MNRTLQIRLWDIVVVGAGPSGMSAAAYAARNGFSTLLLERSTRPGGQLVRWIDHGIFDYPANESISPFVLTERLWLETEQSGAKTVWNAKVTHIMDRQDVNVHISTGDVLSTRSALLCTGVVPRKHEAQGVDSVGWGRPYSGDAISETSNLVIGGGDEACATTLALARSGAKRVFLAARQTISSRPQYRERVIQHSSVEVLEHTVITKICKTPDGFLISGNGVQPVFVHNCFIRIGVETLTPLVQLERPDLLVPRRTRVAGDAAHESDERYVVSAVASGILAARKLCDQLKSGQL